MVKERLHGSIKAAKKDTKSIVLNFCFTFYFKMYITDKNVIHIVATCPKKRKSVQLI